MNTELSPFLRECKISKIKEEFPDKTQFPLYYETKKQEIILNPGEVLFIPVGWWHFVFSEDTDPSTNINFAVNFWYHPPIDWVDGTQYKNCVPYVKRHTFKFDDVIPQQNSVVRVLKMNVDLAIPQDMLYNYTEKQTFQQMTFEEFLKLKDPNSYILQERCEKIERYAPRMKTSLACANIWINFGNIKTLPHYDLYDNCLCQIQGRKRILLFPPEEREKMYPVSIRSPKVLNTLHQIINDIFILKKTDVFRPEFISSVLQKPMLKFVQFHNMRETFYTVVQNIKDILKNENCLIPRFKQPEKFSVIDVQNSEYNVSGYSAHMYTIFWFLTKGILHLRNNMYYVSENSCFAFPTSFLYPWKVVDAVFMVPE
jgi:hypothetical protein